MIKIVHFSITPLAGAPIRLVQTLNRLTGFRARLVDLERFGLYDHDVVFSENPDEANRIANDADIIHLHNYLDSDSLQFFPIDFGKLLREGKRILRHYHSTADWIAEQMKIPKEKLLKCNLPSMVIAQYPERFFENSRVVPNFVANMESIYKPITDHEGTTEYDLFFSPTKTTGAFERRWDTKAAPEVKQLIYRVAARTGCTFKIMSGKPLDEVLRAKQRARIVIDDLVTGSYHLTGLEGLAQGKTVLAFLDERCLHLLRYFSGSTHCPFVNVRLEDAEVVLLWLLDHPSECARIGKSGREWICRYWNEMELVQHYETAYRDLMRDPSRISRQQDIFPKLFKDAFFGRILPDLVFQSRKQRALQP